MGQIVCNYVYIKLAEYLHKIFQFGYYHALAFPLLRLAPVQLAGKAFYKNR